MSAVDNPLYTQPLDEADCDCVAFVSDNQTHGLIKDTLSDYFEAPSVRDGDCQHAISYLSEGTAPTVMIVDIGDDEDSVTELLSLIAAAPAGAKLIGIGNINDVELYRELTSAGLVDYLVKPVTRRSLEGAIAKLHAPTVEDDASSSASQRIAVIGARGGSGSSTVAANLAWISAEEYKIPTTLVDLDMEFGTVALSLDLEPTRGLRDALENPSRIDSLFISSATAKLTDRLSVMAAEETLSTDAVVNPDAIDVLFDTLGRANRCIVVDLPRPAVALRQRVLQTVDQIVVVTETTLPGLRDTLRILTAIEEISSGTPVYLIANRVGNGKQAMATGDFQKALGRKIDLVIPDDPKAFNTAANSGKPLMQCAPSSKAAKAIKAASKKLIAETTEKSQETKSWRNLFKRK